MIKLNKSQILDFLSNRGITTIKSRMIVVDHKDNNIAPERYCYKIYFTCALTNSKRRLAIWPNTVGYQCF